MSNLNKNKSNWIKELLNIKIENNDNLEPSNKRRKLGSKCNDNGISKLDEAVVIHD